MNEFLQNLVSSFSQFGNSGEFDLDFYNVGSNRSDDSDIREIGETAFNVNRFISDQLGTQREGLESFDPNTSYNEVLFEGAWTPGMSEDELNAALYAKGTKDKNLFNIWETSPIEEYHNKNKDKARAVGQAAIDKNREELKTQANLETSSQKLAPVIGAGAGLMKLQELEGAARGRLQKSKYGNSDLYRVNPTNGLPNFLNGGSLDQLPALDKNFTMPEINLSNKKNPAKMFLGGAVTSNEKVGNYREDRIQDRYVSATERAPIQAEVGEMLILPSLDILPVSAKKRHSNMDDDEVTELLPVDSYVLTEHGFNLKRSEAEKVTTEVGALPYDIFGGNQVPTEKYLSDIFDKKEESPAELGRKIANKFKTVDLDDPFTKKTNDENRLNSLPYLQGLIMLSEVEKQKKGIVPPEIPMEQFSDGGKVMTRKAPPKAFLSLAIGGIQAGLGIWNAYQNNKQQGEAKKLYAKNEGKIEQLAERQSLNNDLGTMASLGALAMQDTTVDAPQLSFDRLLQQQDGLSQSQIDSVANAQFRNIPANQVFANTGNFQAGVQALQPTLSSAFDSQSNLNYQNASQAIGISNNRLRQIMDTQNQQEQIDSSKSNAERGNVNSLITGAGSAIAGNLNTDSNIQGNKLNASLANSGAAFAAQTQLQSVQSQNLQNTANSLAQVAATYQNNQNQSTANRSVNGDGVNNGPATTIGSGSTLPTSISSNNPSQAPVNSGQVTIPGLNGTPPCVNGTYHINGQNTGISCQ